MLLITSPTKAESDDYMLTKFYDVTDLLTTAKDYDVHNPLAPLEENKGDGMGYTLGGGMGGMRVSTGPGMAGGMGGMGMGGGMGGGTGGMGGGMFAVAPEREPAPRPLPTPATVNSKGGGTHICPNVSPLSSRGVNANQAAPPNNFSPLIDLITNSVAAKTWVDNGGTGTISHYDHLLVITQTQEVQEQIEQFLAQLRARRQARPTLSVELHWLWLDTQKRDHLLAGKGQPSEGRISLAVDPQRLRQIVHDVPGFFGQIACLNGIGTAIAAGDRRATIQSAIPVVDAGTVGYQPLISVPNVGVTALVRPTFVPGTKSATLEITSVITRWDPSQKAVIVGGAWSGEDLAWKSIPSPHRAQDAAGAGPAIAAAVRFSRRADPFHARRFGHLPCRSAGDADAADRHHAQRSAGQTGDRRRDDLRRGGGRRPRRGQRGPGAGLPDRHDEHRAGCEVAARIGLVGPMGLIGPISPIGPMSYHWQVTALQSGRFTILIREGIIAGVGFSFSAAAGTPRKERPRRLFPSTERGGLPCLGNWCW